MGNAEPGQLPVARQRASQPFEVAAGIVHVGLRNLDIVRVRDRVDFDVVGFVGLADQLPVYLAGCRHIDGDVAAHGRLAA